MFIVTQLWTLLLLAAVSGAGAYWLWQRLGYARPRAAQAVPQRSAVGTDAVQQRPDGREAELIALRTRVAELEAGARQLDERSHAADHEIEVLRRQVAARSTELARVLNQRDVEAETLRSELTAARAALVALQAVTPGAGPGIGAAGGGRETTGPTH